MSEDKEYKSIGEFLDDVSLVKRPLQVSLNEEKEKARQEGFSDAIRYRTLISKVEEGLTMIREEKIPQKITDTGVDFFEISIRKLYRNAKKLSEQYPDLTGERGRELNRLGILVDRACNGLSLSGAGNEGC